MRETPCNTCKGRRLKDEALAVSINSLSIMDVCDLSIDSCYEFFKNLQISETEKYIAKSILKEVLSRLEFLKNVGLNYLTLNRVSSTLIRRRGTKNQTCNTDRIKSYRSALCS